MWVAIYVQFPFHSLAGAHISPRLRLSNEVFICDLLDGVYTGEQITLSGTVSMSSVTNGRKLQQSRSSQCIVNDNFYFCQTDKHCNLDWIEYVFASASQRSQSDGRAEWALRKTRPLTSLRFQTVFELLWKSFHMEESFSLTNINQTVLSSRITTYRRHEILVLTWNLNVQLHEDILRNFDPSGRRISFSSQDPRIKCLYSDCTDTESKTIYTVNKI